MLTKMTTGLLFSGLAGIFLSCSPKNISSNYYYQHERVLDRIEESYKVLYQQQPFTIAFTDREFETITFEILTDTLSYIYQFDIKETRFTDTLIAYHFNAPEIVELIQHMKSIHCTWLNKLEYYVDEKRNFLIMMSIKPVALNAPFSYKKYYTLTYFPQPQSFDSSGQLLDKKNSRRLRKIKGEVFKRINDKVCYSVSGNFR
jgi:hypothetical protein